MTHSSEDTPRPTDRFRYAQLTLDALREEKAFESIGFVPVDVEVIPNFSGEPDRMEAWLIYPDRVRAQEAERHSEALRDRAAGVLETAGFPADALPSFQLNFTSIEEIEERGGRRAFFR